MFSFDEAKSRISGLVDDFDRKIDIIKKGGAYKEANVEDEYIKPLFKYLNWNISNEGIRNIAEREFIVQAKGKGGKEPDYLLQLNGKPCFFMEAKHPKYDLFKQTKYIWQAYSYAYSTQSSNERKKVDFALLTDFEEFRLFDCTFKTDPHLVNNFAVLDWKYRDFSDNFKDLWNIFEREQVARGSLKNLYLNEKKIKQNRIPPDKAFLSDLDDEKTGWRILLAKDIKKFNPELSADYITRVIQLIIDRIVFIKVLTDREIEDDFLTQVIAQVDRAALKSEEGAINESCREIFARMNKTYNGSVFEPRPELDSVKVSNKTLHSILKDLLPENSRYNFNVIPVEILGTIYEQFLGKVVTTTEKRAHIEYKPEVRKAGGVYYTPQYIVDYIVENTVGEKLKPCKTIDDLLSLKICDPACGSGSFLLGAYDQLIRWSVDFYSVKYSTGSPVSKKDMEHVYRDSDGLVRLSGKLKREILKSCIYGVDIDEQAAEVTRMSLSLKALEDTRHDELYSEVNLFHETVLPDLKGNVKCGNSLIGTDYFDGRLDFSTDEIKDVKPFDWEKHFNEIFKNGGFDCVIGNPPYVRQEVISEFKKYFENHYKAYHSIADLYVYFIEKAHRLLKQRGFFGYIVSNKWIRSNYGKPLRDFIRLSVKIVEIIDFGELPVFENAATFPMIIITENITVEEQHFDYAPIKTLEFDSLNDEKKGSSYKIDPSSMNGDNWTLAKHEEIAFFEKMRLNGIPLGEYVNNKIFYGIKTGYNEAFVIDREIRDRLISEDSKNIELIKPFALGDDIRKYKIRQKERYLICIPSGWTDIKSGGVKNKFEWFSKNYPAISDHLKEFEEKAKNRYDQGQYWWELRACDYYNEFEKPKIVYPDIAKASRFSFDNKGMYFTNTVYFIPIDDLFLLGVLNSKPVFSYFKRIAAVLGDADRGGRLRFFTQDVVKIPVPKNRDENIVELVKQTLTVYDKLNNTNNEQDKIALKQHAEMLDRKIDDLVYKLYDLTDKEIEIVEGA